MTGEAPDDDRSWKISSFRHSEGTWRIEGGRQIDQEEVDDLRAKFAFVRELAEQVAFSRLVAAGRRWQWILARAKAEADDEGLLSPRTQRSARDELALTTRLARAVEEDLTADLQERFGPGDRRLGQFRSTLDRLRASPGLLLFANAAGAGEGEVLELVGEEISFVSAHSRSAWEVILGAVGVLAAVVRAHLEARRGEFLPIYKEIEALATEVGDGYPSLVRLKIDEESGSVSGFETVDVPINEARALRQVLNQRLGALPTIEQVQSMAVLEVARLDQHLLFGATEAGHALTGGNLQEGLEQPATAEVQLDVNLLGSVPIDYWAPVVVRFEQGPTSEERFKGSVQAAKGDGRIVNLELEGATELTEHSARGMLVEGMSPEEAVTALIRQSGLAPEAIRLEHPPAPGQEEDFELLAPLRGVAVREEVALGPVVLAPPAVGLTALDAFTSDQDDAAIARLIEEFRHADSYVRAEVRTREIDLAEDQGLVEAETAVAWLVTRSRFAEATLPNGSVQAFSRQESLRVPELGPVVLVRGRATERRWLRWPGGRAEPAHRTLEQDSPALEPPLPADVALRERQALLALERAVRETDPLSQVQTLWQAIEAYVAGTKASADLFSLTELEDVRQRLADEWSFRQQEKLDWVMGMLNDPSASVRLRWRLMRDGVRITDEELELLDKLRKARNAIVHGRQVGDKPTREEINQGVGLVARMLVHRIAALPGR